MVHNQNISAMKPARSFRNIVSCTLVIGLIVAAGCTKKDNGSTSELLASAGNDFNVLIGSKVNLNGDGSTDLSGNTFEFSWSFLSKPASSNASLADNTTATPSFTADVQGKYKIELVISNLVEDRDTITISAFKTANIGGNYENIIPGSNVGVRRFTVFSTYLVATCEFTRIGSVAANKIAVFNGSDWAPLGCGLEEGSIYGMLEYKGELYVTGQFDEIGCISAKNIARWNKDTSTWEDVSGGLSGGDNPFGYTLAIYNEELYVGGQFEMAGNVNTTNIAKWDGTNWHAVGNMEGGSVRKLVVYKQRLIAGGFFSGVNGLATGHIASYDGNNWASLGSFENLELKSTGVVRHMAVYKDILYISGDFSKNNDDISELITWNGIQFSDFGRAFSLSQNTINELAVVNGLLYIGGSIRNAVGSQANNILQWDGDTWGIMSEGISGTVLSIVMYNNMIFIGGDFDYAGGKPAENISIWLAT